MPKGKPTPKYKFRLLCKTCNSYEHTFVEIDDAGDLLLCCTHCGIDARELTETIGTLREE